MTNEELLEVVNEIESSFRRYSLEHPKLAPEIQLNLYKLKFYSGRNCISCKHFEPQGEASSTWCGYLGHDFRLCHDLEEPIEPKEFVCGHWNYQPVKLPEEVIKKRIKEAKDKRIEEQGIKKNSNKKAWDIFKGPIPQHIRKRYRGKPKRGVE